MASVWLQAADNPTGPTANSSTGKFDIVLRNDVQIRLFGLEDVSFNTASATTGDLTGFTPSCVDSNVEKYEVSLTSSNDFALVPGSGTATVKIPYSLTYSQKGGAADQIWGKGHLGSGVAAGSFTRDGVIGGNTCDAALESRITADIIEADYKGKDVGVYSDTVTVTVSSI
ncbi:hypothetical protein [Endozoicomonas sp. 2B-B]